MGLGLTSREELAEKGVYFISVGKPDLSFPMKCVVDGWDDSIPLYMDQADHDHEPPILALPPDRAPESCAAIIVDIHDEAWHNQDMLPRHLFVFPHTVIFSSADANYHLNAYNLVTTHHHDFVKYFSPRQPWTFGISKQMLAFSLQVDPDAPRRPVISRRFRNSLSQSVRSMLDFCLVPLLEENFEIDRSIKENGRWNEDYWQHLTECYACLAYGGAFMVDLERIGNNYDPKLVVDPIMARWDSWRLWESLMTATPAVMPHFEKYGFRLPVQPVAFEHYIPLDLTNPAATRDFLVQQPERVKAIGRQGREFVLQHYSPKPSAQRFISMLVEPRS